MAALFADVPEAISNTRRIAEMTDLKFDFGHLRLPDFPVPEGHTVGELAARRVPARSRGALRHGHRGDPAAPGLRAGRDHQHGLPRLLPDRGGLRALRPRAAHRHHLPRLRPRLDRDLHAGHHAGRSDPLRAAVRALPQPGPRDHAGHRRGLRGQPARRGDRLRHAQVRLGPRGPDHHLRHHARPGRDPRRRADPGHGLRRGRPDRQGHPQPAGHQARGGAGDRAALARDGRHTTRRWPS